MHQTTRGIEPWMRTPGTVGYRTLGAPAPGADKLPAYRAQTLGAMVDPRLNPYRGDYGTYGQTGGEHLFFNQDPRAPIGPLPRGTLPPYDQYTGTLDARSEGAKLGMVDVAGMAIGGATLADKVIPGGLKRYLGIDGGGGSGSAPTATGDLTPAQAARYAARLASEGSVAPTALPGAVAALVGTPATAVQAAALGVPAGTTITEGMALGLTGPASTLYGTAGVGAAGTGAAAPAAAPAFGAGPMGMVAPFAAFAAMYGLAQGGKKKRIARATRERGAMETAFNAGETPAAADLISRFRWSAPYQNADTPESASNQWTEAGDQAAREFTAANYTENLRGYAENLLGTRAGGLGRIGTLTPAGRAAAEAFLAANPPQPVDVQPRPDNPADWTPLAKARAQQAILSGRADLNMR